MVGGIIGWAFGAVWLVAPLWVFFDAEERKRNAITWATLTLVFGPFGLGAYAITQTRGDRDLVPGARGRQYFFTASFLCLLIAYASLVGLFAVALDAAWSEDPIGGDDARLATAILLALLVFGLPLWAFHWTRAQALLQETTDERTLRVLFYMERGYGGAVLFFGILVALGFGVYLVFSLFAAILGVFEGGSQQFIPVAAFLPLTLIVLGYHWAAIFGSKEYSEMAKRFLPSASAAATAPIAPAPAPVRSAIPPPPAVPAASIAAATRRFCGQCGAPNPATHRFCEACGSPLASPGS